MQLLLSPRGCVPLFPTSSTILPRHDPQHRSDAPWATRNGHLDGTMVLYFRTQTHFILAVFHLSKASFRPRGSIGQIHAGREKLKAECEDG